MCVNPTLSRSERKTAEDFWKYEAEEDILGWEEVGGGAVTGWWTLDNGTHNFIPDFILSPYSVCCILYLRWFPGVWMIYGDVSERRGH
jgi:hypothetical protein